jgi:hypothetical protein
MSGYQPARQCFSPRESGHALISEDQTFIVPLDAPDGEYVGRIRLFPQFEESGAAPAFTFTQNHEVQ